MGFSSYNQTQSKSPTGVYFIKPELRDQYEWFNISQLGTQVRLFPELSQDGQPMPIRFGPTPRDLGNWAEGRHVGIFMKGGGDEPGKVAVSLILAIQGDEHIEDPRARRGVQVWRRIVDTLHGRLEQGVAPPHWSRWAADKFPTVMGPKSKCNYTSIGFVRGMCTFMQRKGGPMQNCSIQEPRIPCIFTLKSNAQAGLIEKLMEVNPEAQFQSGADYDGYFTHNNILDPAAGKLLNFGKQGQAAYVGSGQIPPAGSGGDTFAVECHVTDQVLPVTAEQLQQCWKHKWEDVLQIWRDEKHLITALNTGLPDELIIESFKDMPDWLPDNLRARMQQQQQQAAAGNFQQPPVQGAPVAPVAPVQQPVAPAQVAPAPAPVAPAPAPVTPPPAPQVSPAMPETPAPAQQPVVEQAPPATTQSADAMLDALQRSAQAARSASTGAAPAPEQGGEAAPDIPADV